MFLTGNGFLSGKMTMSCLKLTTIDILRLRLVFLAENRFLHYIIITLGEKKYW